MRKIQITLLLAAPLLFAFAAAAQDVNKWRNRGGNLLVTRGWLNAAQNDLDGQFCLFSGHSAVTPENDVFCYDASINKWTRVYPGNKSASQPVGGDLHAWGWDHIGKEYFLFDGSKVGWRAYAFNPVTKAWRRLTDADFPGLDDRSFIDGAGIATSPDHDLMVIAHGSNSVSVGNVVRILDLKNRTYSEMYTGIPPNRKNIQHQFLYISSLKKFLLFGGRGASGALRDLWLFDPASKTWMPIAHNNPPPGTYNGHMAYDSVQNVVYLVGGEGGSARVWILHLSNWTWEQLPLPSGTALVDYPTRRRYGIALFHPVAGFCTAAGALDSAAYWQSYQTWCFKHSLSIDDEPPQEPGPGNTNFVPSNLGDLTVSWAASPSDPGDVQRYELQRSEDGGATWVDQVNIPAAGSSSYSHTYKGVVDGPARVRAVDAAGNASEYIIAF
ncbi:MAG TPA: kelch repeat-containing protein [Candidatus Acidoferrales bacterium]|nr:kelch repeat-containing protein [Candidatus Acidoferrales bacterium]